MANAWWVGEIVWWLMDGTDKDILFFFFFGFVFLCSTVLSKERVLCESLPDLSEESIGPGWRWDIKFNFKINYKLIYLNSEAKTPLRKIALSDQKNIRRCLHHTFVWLKLSILLWMKLNKSLRNLILTERVIILLGINNFTRINLNNFFLNKEI